MRPSSRQRILEAAVRVLDREGGATVSFEAVAEESGLSKAGILYHFPTREDLMLGVVGHVAGRWEAAMIEALPGPFEGSTAAERVRAYAAALAGAGASRADFAVYSDALYRPAHGGPWREVLGRWFAPTEGLTPAACARLEAARFAAEGLWVAEATGFGAPEDRDAVISEILALTETVPDERTDGSGGGA